MATPTVSTPTTAAANDAATKNAGTNSVPTVAPSSADKSEQPVTTASATKPNAPAISKKATSNEVIASAKRPATAIERDDVEAPSADEDRQFLSVVSTREPSMRATVESQLQAVNEDIRQVQEYLARNPQDVDARQQLMDAYQKKALLYQIALDRIQ
jgi:ribosomal protein S15P/S13E